MGLFDKFLKSGSDGPNPQEIQGIIHRNDPIELNGIFCDRKTITVHGEYKDPSKAIDAIHWDGLTPGAQEALSKQGFYRDGDDSIEVIIIEP